MVKTHIKTQVTHFFINYKESCYRLAYSYVKNAEDALDVIQESVCKAFLTLETLKSPEYIKTWFYRIIVNTSIDLLRQRKRYVAVGDESLDDLECSEADCYEDIDLRRALEDLPVEYKSVIVLRFFEDLKIDEVASVLNENVNTVKTRLYKALKLLRVRMDEE